MTIATAKPCRHCGGTERVNNRCQPCRRGSDRVRQAIRRKANPEKRKQIAAKAYRTKRERDLDGDRRTRREAVARWRRQHPEKDKANRLRGYQKNIVTRREKARETMASTRKADPEKYRNQMRQWRDNNREKLRAYNRERSLRKFGITPAEYDAMLARQNGTCAICHLTNPGGRRLAVDHCHDTGQVRALLCTNCNTAIGSLLHSPTLCRQAAEYLQQHDAEVSHL